MNFGEFASATLKNGGATLNVDGVVNPYSNGYQIAIAPIAHGPISGASVEELADVLYHFAAEYAEVIGIPAHHDIGTWVDSDGICHLEETLWVESVNDALALGILYEQYSVWDWKNGAEIVL